MMLINPFNHLFLIKCQLSSNHQISLTLLSLNIIISMIFVLIFYLSCSNPFIMKNTHIILFLINMIIAILFLISGYNDKFIYVASIINLIYNICILMWNSKSIVPFNIVKKYKNHSNIKIEFQDIFNNILELHKGENAYMIMITIDNEKYFYKLNASWNYYVDKLVKYNIKINNYMLISIDQLKLIALKYKSNIICKYKSKNDTKNTFINKHNLDEPIGETILLKSVAANINNKFFYKTYNVNQQILHEKWLLDSNARIIYNSSKDKLIALLTNLPAKDCLICLQQKLTNYIVSEYSHTKPGYIVSDDNNTPPGCIVSDMKNGVKIKYIPPQDIYLDVTKTHYWPSYRLSLCHDGFIYACFINNYQETMPEQIKAKIQNMIKFDFNECLDGN